jgi:hypothetical protein
MRCAFVPAAILVTLGLIASGCGEPTEGEVDAEAPWDGSEDAGELDAEARDAGTDAGTDAGEGDGGDVKEDAGPGGADAGERDTGLAGLDAGLDGGGPDLDASTSADASRDAGLDAGLDGGGPGLDASTSVDASPDADLDASTSADASPDAGLDASTSADASRDAGLDASTSADASRDSGPSCPAPGGAVTWSCDARPIFERRCGPCHTVGGSGGANFATSYSDSQLPSYSCPGSTKGACTVVRIRDRSMPLGAPGSVTASEIAVLDAWIGGGQLP